MLNPDLTVEKALKEAEKDIGAPAKITGFVRFALGEGIEKEETDFAAEVAAAAQEIARASTASTIAERASRDIAVPFVYRRPRARFPTVAGRRSPTSRTRRGLTMTAKPLYRRVLLKASGEALMGEQGFGIDVSVVDRIAADIAEARALGVEVGVVIGGGNIFRGVAVASKGGDRVTGDHMGMLATVINSLALRTSLVKLGVDARGAVGDRHAGDLRELLAAPGDGLHGCRASVVIFAGGTGNPFFTTDSAAALARRRDRRRRAVQGHAGRRRLFRRSQEAPGCRPLRAHQPQDVLSKGLPIMDTAADCACARKPHSDNRLFDPREGRFRRHSEGRRPLHGRSDRLTAAKAGGEARRQR